MTNFIFGRPRCALTLKAAAILPFILFFSSPGLCNTSLSTTSIQDQIAKLGASIQKFKCDIPRL